MRARLGVSAQPFVAQKPTRWGWFPGGCQGTKKGVEINDVVCVCGGGGGAAGWGVSVSKIDANSHDPMSKPFDSPNSIANWTVLEEFV